MPVYSIYAQQLILILYTGLRIGEALALTWEDWDIKNKLLNINKNLVLIKNTNESSSAPNKKFQLYKIMMVKL